MFQKEPTQSNFTDSCWGFLESVPGSGLCPHNITVNQTVSPLRSLQPIRQRNEPGIEENHFLLKNRLVWELVAVGQNQFCSENLPNEYWQVSYAFSIKPFSSGKCL